ncbi:ABC transporter ATP-binding protein [Algoriphagus marinus]|uniref:ABC transporter ATP-binding protein n=1 Tax=Algoriphagus marinus TaxID=1925762 RepID=UPI00094B8091|nr:ABC transporter ATP-binding protein [Algoriphagus marinus]
MISIQHIHKNFGKLKVLEDFNLEFKSGKSYALMGPNGSGKTTLIKIILGMVIPTQGEVWVKDKPISQSESYRSLIGYMPQIGRYPENIKMKQLFAMMKDMRPTQKDYDEELIEAFGLNMIMDKAMHTLSGGTRQKVSAALAFLFRPEILILDEPTAGLDPISVEILKTKIMQTRESGKLVIITSHILSELEELTNHAIYIHEGKVVFNDSIAELKEITGKERFSAAIASLMEWSLKKNPDLKILNHA